MVKYFCDVCGRELRIADRVQITTDLDFVKTQSLIQGLALGTATRLLCFDCYSKLVLSVTLNCETSTKTTWRSASRVRKLFDIII